MKASARGFCAEGCVVAVNKQSQLLVQVQILPHTILLKKGQAENSSRRSVDTSAMQDGNLTFEGLQASACKSCWACRHAK